MEENIENLKVLFLKNLDNVNFTTTFNISLDSNVNFKQVLSVDCFMYDEKTECSSGKANFTGKIAVKVVYLDTENITNVITDNSSFSTNLLDASITSDSIVVIKNKCSTSSIVSQQDSLKINCDSTICSCLYLNMPLKNISGSQDYMITKKTEVNTLTCAGKVDCDFDIFENLETKDNVSKILDTNSYVALEKISCLDGTAVVEGKIFSMVLFESNKDDVSELKELSSVQAFKNEINVNNLNKDMQICANVFVNKNNTSVDTAQEDDVNIITINNKICICGVALKNISLELVDDLYSLENETEINSNYREIVTSVSNDQFNEYIGGEISLNDDEPAIEDVVSNNSIGIELTDKKLDNGSLTVEGVIVSNIVYQDENKEYKNKLVELPFSVNLKTNTYSQLPTCLSVSILDSKIKSKRGTKFELEYNAVINVENSNLKSCNVIDNITLGKPLDFSMYDYQIFLAKPNETIWELSKRIKISPEDLIGSNPNLVEPLQGGERVVIKR